MRPLRQGTPDSGVEETFESPPRSFKGLAKAVSQGRTVMVCETPLDGSARASGFLDIRGWAYSRAGLDRVLVYLDGLRYDARIGVPRPELEGLFGVDLTRSGFDLTIELDAGQAGRLAVTVVVRGADGHAVGVRGTVDCVPEPDILAAPRARQDGPARAGETFEASAVDTLERLVPDGWQRSVLEAEHDARYGWTAGLVRDREVLDAGCGAGRGTAILAAAGATRAVGVDISDDAVRGARERCGSAAQFVVGDLSELAFEDCSFDVVTCFETLAQVGDLERALDELRRVLRPGGVLLLSLPNGAAGRAGNPLYPNEYRPHEIAEALGRRFAEVGLYRQQSHFASLVWDDASFAEPAGEQDLAARVRGATRAGPGEELCTVVAASDAELPQMETLASIGGRLERRAWHDLAQGLQERVLTAEAQASASDAEARAARLESARSMRLLQRAEDARREAEALKSSVSWRITRPLRLAQRMRGRARHALGRVRRALRPAPRVLGFVRRALRRMR
jgi:SAM-dependent methyltransferase